jgi:hypothetical protein
VPHRRDHDEVAKNRCIFAAYEDAPEGTLSIKDLEKPQRITESQYVEDMLRWITRKLSPSTQDVRCAPSSRVAGPWSRREGLGVVRKINQPFQKFSKLGGNAVAASAVTAGPPRQVSSPEPQLTYTCLVALNFSFPTLVNCLSVDTLSGF